MNMRRIIHRVFLIAASITALTVCAMAQPGGVITADPNAKQLRLIWMVKGNPVGGTSVGEGVGGLGDIFGIGRGAWAVNYGALKEWRIYRHDSANIAADTVPVWTFGHSGGFYPVVGDFWGSGHKAVGFM